MYCSLIDLVAPGVNIYSTFDGNIFQSNCSDIYTGSYYAASFVAGVAALVLELLPCATVQEVKTILCKTAKKLPNYTFNNDPDHPEGTWNNEVGYGLIDAYAATMEAKRIKNAYENLVQNVDVTGTKLVVSLSEIKAGRSVNPNKIEGSVNLLENSLTSFKASSSINIKNGFMASAKSKFHAKITPYTGIGCYYYAISNKKSGKENLEKPEKKTKELSNNLEKPIFYPNPTNSDIFVNYYISNFAHIKILLTNLLGEKYWQKDYDLNAGQYIERIQNNYSDKILIAKIYINNEIYTEKIINNNGY